MAVKSLVKFSVPEVLLAKILAAAVVPAKLTTVAVVSPEPV